MQLWLHSQKALVTVVSLTLWMTLNHDGKRLVNCVIALWMTPVVKDLIRQLTPSVIQHSGRRQPVNQVLMNATVWTELTTAMNDTGRSNMSGYPDFIRYTLFLLWMPLSGRRTSIAFRPVQCHYKGVQITTHRMTLLGAQNQNCPGVTRFPIFQFHWGIAQRFAHRAPGYPMLTWP